MEQQLNSHLVEILEALDQAILSAVEAPDSAGGPSLGRVQTLCRKLAREQFRLPARTGMQAPETSYAETSDLLWQVRSRAGRLKLLLDSAAYFYAGLSSPQTSGAGYNARGEWKGQAASRLIRIRC